MPGLKMLKGTEAGTVGCSCMMVFILFLGVLDLFSKGLAAPGMSPPYRGHTWRAMAGTTEAHWKRGNEWVFPPVPAKRVWFLLLFCVFSVAWHFSGLLVKLWAAWSSFPHMTRENSFSHLVSSICSSANLSADLCVYGMYINQLWGARCEQSPRKERLNLNIQLAASLWLLRTSSQGVDISSTLKFSKAASLKPSHELRRKKKNKLAQTPGKKYENQRPNTKNIQEKKVGNKTKRNRKVPTPLKNHISPLQLRSSRLPGLFEPFWKLKRVFRMNCNSSSITTPAEAKRIRRIKQPNNQATRRWRRTNKQANGSDKKKDRNKNGAIWLGAKLIFKNLWT